MIIRGVPGSGKSTLALALVQSGLFDVQCEADSFFTTKEGEYKYVPHLVPCAHEWCYRKVEQEMAMGKNIILSNTSTVLGRSECYYDLANRYGYIVQEIVIPKPPFQSVHNVPVEHIQKMQNQLNQSIKQLSEIQN
jgi:predicted kinase